MGPRFGEVLSFSGEETACLTQRNPVGARHSSGSPPWFSSKNASNPGPESLNLRQAGNRRIFCARGFEMKQGIGGRMRAGVALLAIGIVFAAGCKMQPSAARTDQ